MRHKRVIIAQHATADHHRLRLEITHFRPQRHAVARPQRADAGIRVTLRSIGSPSEPITASSALQDIRDGEPPTPDQAKRSDSEDSLHKRYVHIRTCQGSMGGTTRLAAHSHCPQRAESGQAPRRGYPTAPHSDRRQATPPPVVLSYETSRAHDRDSRYKATPSCSRRADYSYDRDPYDAR